MAKKMVKYEASLVAYSLGILSIVFSFFQPAAAIILAIVGLVQGKRQPSDLSKRAKKLNIIGLVLGVLLLAVSLYLTIALATKGALTSFPN